MLSNSYCWPIHFLRQATVHVISFFDIYIHSATCVDRMTFINSQKCLHSRQDSTLKTIFAIFLFFAHRHDVHICQA